MTVSTAEYVRSRTRRLTTETLALSAILASFIILGTVYSVVTPLSETPDEIWHYLYVKHLADGGGLPVYREGDTFPMRQEASQPPLYYVINGWLTSWINTGDAEAVTRYNPHAAIGVPSALGNRNVMTHTAYERFPYRGAVLAMHVARFFSVLMGAATVLCTYAIARRVFPQSGRLPLAAAAFNAFIPQFVFISASINNDVLTTLLASVTLWLLVCLVQDGATGRHLVALGVVLGLAALTKLNALVLLPLSAVVLAWLARRQQRLRALVSWGIWTYGAAAITGAWWYARNWWLYRDPFGLRLMFAVMPVRSHRPSPAEMARLLSGAFKSFWAVFGWFNIPVDPWIYTAFQIVVVAGLLGLLALLWRSRSQPQHNTDLLPLLLLWSGTFVLALVGWMQARWPQGRLVFPAISAIATLLVAGISQWLPMRVRRTAATALLACLLALAAIAPFRYIAPAYRPGAIITANGLPPGTQPLAANLGDELELAGYAVEGGPIRLGDTLTVRLYWHALNRPSKDYSVFVHLVDARGVIVAQRDSYPAGGNSPTRDLAAGEKIEDICHISIPTIVLAEPPLRIRVGVYDYATGARLPVLSGAPTRDHVELPGHVALALPPTNDMQTVQLEFDGQIALTGYRVERITAQPGDRIGITLRWQALEKVGRDCTVFAHLMRSNAQIWGQDDHWPVDGDAPTRTWVAGQVINDEFELQVSPDAPEDTYDLIVGLYDSKTVKRLALPDGIDWVVLGKVKVSRGTVTSLTNP